MMYRNIPITHDGYTGIPWFLMHLGAYGEVKVWVQANHLEEALEAACDWLADNAPGIFTILTEDDYRAAAEEAGIPWPEGERFYWIDSDHEAMGRIAEHAERDLYVVGHTTYPQFKGTPAIPSWEWSYTDATEEECADLDSLVREECA